MIYRHPAAISADKQSDLMISHYDFLPTVLNYLGLENKIPDKPKLPGRDYSAVLRDQQTEWENVIYYEFENSRMIRTPDWKYTRRFPDGPDELYDLRNDPSERKNLINEQKYADIQRQLHERLSAFFDYYADPKYDLWRSGGSKSILSTFNKKPLPPPAKVQNTSGER